MYKLLLLAFGAGLMPLAAERISEEVFVRLSSPLTTKVPAGEKISGVVTGCVRADCLGLLPPGSSIEGHVRQVRAVGYGLRRERASMALEFTACRLPDGGEIPCYSQLRSIDNARETVTKGNRINGILAADHPHSLLSGVWFRPTTAVFTRSLSGLNGAGRMIYSGITPHPVFAGAIIVSRLLFLRLPEPEIQLPAGAELVVMVTADAGERTTAEAPVPGPVALTDWLADVPVRVTMPDGSNAADIINFAFRGSSAELALAFLGAGWSSADPLNRRTFVRSYRAFTEMRPYPTAPVSPLRYQGRLPDLVFQKSLNCMAKRHHIRLWKTDAPGGEVWLGAATHDVGIAFDWKRLTLTHRIDHEIDRERDKVLADLSYAGCAKRLARVERPKLAQDTARMATDGALQFVEARTCQQPLRQLTGIDVKKRPSLGRLIVRRTILETRHYVVRGNAYYWTLRGLRSQSISGLFARSKSGAKK